MRHIIKEGGTPAFLGYRGFPASACISVNEEIIHGIPSPHRKIHNDDIVSIDIGVVYQGGIADSAYTFFIGKNTPRDEITVLLKTTKLALQRGIETIRQNSHISDIAKAIQPVAKAQNLGIVKEYCGHGVGTELHESPEIPNYYPNRSSNHRLKAGMVIAVEPMFTLGNGKISHLDDETTVISADSTYAAHFEHTILVTEDGYDILTK